MSEPSKHAAQSPRLTAIICTYNRYDVLPHAIASLEMQSCGSELFELIVVDNSDDISAQTEFCDGLAIACDHRYLFEKIKGLSRARNIGVRAARGEFVAFLDDDARVSTDWVERLIETFDLFPKAGIVGGPVTPIWPVTRPTWLHPWLEGFLTIVDRGPDVRVLQEHEWLAGTNIAFRTELAVSCGLFNENVGRVGKLLLSNEELALAQKIHELGFVSVYNPAAIVHHRVHADRVNQAWMRRRVFWQVISDMFTSNGEVGETLEEDVNRIFDFLKRLPRKDRNLLGLFEDTPDADLFQAQTEALSALTRLMAANGEDWRSLLRD